MKEESLRLAVLTALRDAIDAEVESIRGAVTSSLLDARDAMGVKSLEVSLPDGRVVASLTVTDPEAKATVVDERQFVEWVRGNAPTELVESVRSSFQRAVLGRVEVTGDGRAVDPETGEVVDGVGLGAKRSPYISLRYKSDGRQAIASAWRSAELPDIIPAIDSPS